VKKKQSRVEAVKENDVVKTKMKLECFFILPLPLLLTWFIKKINLKKETSRERKKKRKKDRKRCE